LHALKQSKTTRRTHHRKGPLLFSWPSQGKITGYGVDREAVLYSRDHLVKLLVSLSAGKPSGEIALFGHSMGSFLIVEVIRQLKLSGRDDVIRRLRVILAAPDIDSDVFRTQLSTIGKLSPPLMILVSRDDRALMVSSFLDGNHPRVGRLDINDPAIRNAAATYGVQVVDISEIEATDSFGHDRYTSLAPFYVDLASLDDDGGKSRGGKVGAFIVGAADQLRAKRFKPARYEIGSR
jgi:esterase/lipase superfamily enzyme